MQRFMYGDLPLAYIAGENGIPAVSDAHVLSLLHIRIKTVISNLEQRVIA
jgi:hypothetical protein